jgi:hypothetical protein
MEGELTLPDGIFKPSGTFHAAEGRKVGYTKATDS